VLALHAARSLLVKQQTMLANAIRGLASEFGLIVPLGLPRLEDLMPGSQRRQASQLRASRR
jgi:error-prone DNA polymerase